MFVRLVPTRTAPCYGTVSRRDRRDRMQVSPGGAMLRDSGDGARKRTYWSSTEKSKSRRGIGRLVVTVSEAIFVKRNQGTFLENRRARCASVRQVLPLPGARRPELFTASAMAVAGQTRLAAGTIFPAAFPNVIPSTNVLTFLFMKAATAGMIGAPFRRTPAGIAFARALPGAGRGRLRCRYRRRKRVYGNQTIDQQEKR